MENEDWVEEDAWVDEDEVAEGDVASTLYAKHRTSRSLESIQVRSGRRPPAAGG